MGVDAEIYFETFNGEKPKLEWNVDDWWEIENLSDENDVYELGSATHAVNIKGNDRYYSVGYERGYWPGICKVLMLLLSSEDVVRVWYGGDSGWTLPECTIQDVLKLSKHFMEHGNRPYRSKG